MDHDRAKDMKTKITVLTLCAMLFAVCFSASAEQAGKIFRIGVPRFEHRFGRRGPFGLVPTGVEQAWMD